MLVKCLYGVGFEVSVCTRALHSAWDDTKEKLVKMKAYNEKLMESLGYALDKIPFPDGGPNANNKKKKVQWPVTCLIMVCAAY